MNKIPTAAEFRAKKLEKIEGDLFNSDLDELIIEFAKLHVEAALKNQTKILKRYMINNVPIPSNKSIMESYPLSNIK